jgi:hypothetical protein
LRNPVLDCWAPGCARRQSLARIMPRAVGARGLDLP